MSTHTKQDKDQQLHERRAAMLLEYEMLRGEFLSDKESRMHTLGFTIAGIGTAMAFVLGLESSALETYNNFSFGLIAYSLIMVLIALILTTNFTKSISRIGVYIKHVIEPHFDGLNWESNWQSGLLSQSSEVMVTKHKKQLKKRKRGLLKHAAKGQSRAYAMYYIILSSAIFSVSFMVELHQIKSLMIIICFIYALCLYLSLNLWLRIFGTWEPKTK